MNEKQIKKNKLDLEYNKYTQILNAVFIFLTTGILGFIGSFIFIENRDKLFLGIGISVFVLIIGYVIYKRTDNKLRSIIREVEKI